MGVGLVFDDLDRLLQLTRMLASESQEGGLEKRKTKTKTKKKFATVAINETKAVRDNSGSLE